jgi:hypothetical protein
MTGKKHYAYKQMLPLLWQAAFYLLVMAGAALLVMGSDSLWDKLLVLTLVLGGVTYAYVQVRRFLKTYYRVDEDSVLFMQNGVPTLHHFDDLEDVQYDSTHVGIQLVFNSGYIETHMEYNDLTPLITALDVHGIRIEYKKMDGK